MGHGCSCWRFSRRNCGTRLKKWCPRQAFFLTMRWGCKEMLLAYKPRYGYYAVKTKIPRCGAIVTTQWPMPRCQTMKRVSVKSKMQPGQPLHLAAVETTLFHCLPSLVAHMAVNRYEDGEPRQMGWVQIKTQGAAWIVQLVDPDACAQLQAMGSTLDDALVLADALVSATDAPWEIAQWLARKSAGKKK